MEPLADHRQVRDGILTAANTVGGRQRQVSRMDAGLAWEATGRTRASSSARNRSGWVKAAKWPASLISASSLVGASTSSKYSVARVVRGRCCIGCDRV
jgi:hypothetical protein